MRRAICNFRRKGGFNVWLPVNRIAQKNKKTVLCLSLLIFIIDIVFLSINYLSLKENFYTSLLQQAKMHQEEFRLNLKMAYENMLQTSTLISSNSELGQCLLKKEKGADCDCCGEDNFTAGVKKEPKIDVDRIAKESLPDFMKNGPFFLQEDKRIYSWLRGFFPVWTVNPETKKKVYVGALEVSTSFKQIVPLYSQLFRVEAAVLLNKAYVQKKRQDEYAKAYFKRHPRANHYLEVTSSAEVHDILPQIFIRNDYLTNKIKLIEKKSEGTEYYSVYYFPLLDYQITDRKKTYSVPAGFLLIWEDVSKSVSDHIANMIVRAILAILAFILIEIGLIWIFNRETRLSVAEQYATVDELTGLFNRRYLDELLHNELRYTEGYDTVLPLSLIICDVDFFKRFNDTYGHSAGDECLQKIANTLKAQARRSSDCVARYGGEEFVLVLPHTDLNAAIDIAEGARKAIAALGIPHSSSEIKPVVTVTLGVACTCNLAEYDSLFDAADRKLYLAKNSGRNKVEPQKQFCFSVKPKDS